MPAKGFKSLTIPEEDYLFLKKRAESEGKSLARVVMDAFRRLEDLGQRVQETPHPSVEVDLTRFEEQVRLLRAEMGRLADRVDRLEEELGELEESSSSIEAEGVSESLTEELRGALLELRSFLPMLTEWRKYCDLIFASRIKHCRHVQHGMCTKLGKDIAHISRLYCAHYCVDFEKYIA